MKILNSILLAIGTVSAFASAENPHLLSKFQPPLKFDKEVESQSTGGIFGETVTHAFEIGGEAYSNGSADRYSISIERQDVDDPAIWSITENDKFFSGGTLLHAFRSITVNTPELKSLDAAKELIKANKQRLQDQEVGVVYSEIGVNLPMPVFSFDSDKAQYNNYNWKINGDIYLGSDTKSGRKLEFDSEKGLLVNKQYINSSGASNTTNVKMVSAISLESVNLVRYKDTDLERQVEVITTTYVSNISENWKGAASMKISIPERAKVQLRSDPQIAAQWRGGKVVRVFDDQIAEELSQADFRQPSHGSTRKWIIGTLCGIAVLIALLGFQRSRKK